MFNCKILGQDLSNCRLLQQNVDVISGGEEIVTQKFTNIIHKVVDAHDEVNDSLTQVVEFVIKPLIPSFMVHPVVI